MESRELGETFPSLHLNSVPSNGFISFQLDSACEAPKFRNPDFLTGQMDVYYYMAIMGIEQLYRDG
jgi:hypothetical protein